MGLIPLNKSRFGSFNDGVVTIYREKDRRSSFAAKENVSVLDDMTFVAKLDYEESSKREQDIEFAQQRGFELSLKIRTRYLPIVDNKCKCIIGDYLYDVSYLDKNRTEMWLYLQGVKKIVSR